MANSPPTPRREAGLGPVLREWRARRHLSQLALALKAGVSQRHLSFVELGRTQPSREMVLRLAAELDVPLRERNRFLLAAGYAPLFEERPLDDPALAGALRAIERVLAGHEPYPAIAVDRRWNLLAANRAFGLMTAGVPAALLEPPANVLRLTLHPAGLAGRILNLAEWGTQLLHYLERQVAASGDVVLADLLCELRGYAPPADPELDASEVFVPLRLATDGGVLSLISTVTVFASPVEVTLSELVMECFFPADDATAALLQSAAPMGGLHRV